MKQLLIIFFAFLLTCNNSNDKLIMTKVGEELGVSGTIGFYRSETEYSEFHNYKKYFTWQLDCPRLFEVFDSTSIRKAFAYRTYIKLSELDKKEYEAIKVEFKNDINSELDTASFFKMSYLEKIYKSEMIVREYMKALKDENLDYIEKAFDKTKFGYAVLEVDSINNTFLEFANGKFEESRLMNWAIIEDAGSKYKLLVFLTNSENNYGSKFQFALHDSLKTEKNIVKISY
ncbi:MAG: hypothetical protein JEY96_16700 [Bacteroidales bacterium]|nr:hypothetical protein [Bacteroidales bacterium]